MDVSSKGYRMNTLISLYKNVLGYVNKKTLPAVVVVIIIFNLAFVTFGFGAEVQFGPQSVITSAVDYARSVYAIDIDGDTDIDVVAIGGDDSNDDKVAWYENTAGNGSTWTEHVISTNADEGKSVYAIDLDGVNGIDVLSASRTDDTIAWYQNDGSQNFTKIDIFSFADGAKGVYAADIDGDGDVDVFSAASWTLSNEWGDRIWWHENDGSENFFHHPITDTSTTDGANSVCAADIDGDTRIDLLSASYYDDTVAWYKNALGPDIDVQGNGTSIYNGDTSPDFADHTDFGNADITSGTVDRSFTVENTGIQPLNLLGIPFVEVSGTHSGDFTVTIQPASPIGPGGGTTTFTVRFDPSAVCLRSATISLYTNDNDEVTYTYIRHSKKFITQTMIRKT